ncbi:MAG: hypothetical protein K2Q10_00580 [Rhodospirillales bacterium]|nr:hypothetical protein [Rhodospirillales bacterium]
MTVPDWWRQPRLIHVVVDNPSWILPHAEALVAWIDGGGDRGVLCRDHDSIGQGAIAFYLGCLRLTPPAVLARNRVNLVVHESDLPKGRGFAPVGWQILEGADAIPVCLIEMTEEADAGPIVLREVMHFRGNELLPELRDAQGRTTVTLCRAYLSAPTPPAGRPQSGAPTSYPRRRPKDSELDPSRSIAEQFNLLRIIDNERYPAFFDYAGRRYRLRIEPWDET